MNAKLPHAMAVPDWKAIRDTLIDLANQYPPAIRQDQIGDVSRIAFHIEIILDACGPDASVCDIGGGVGLLSVGCAALGMKATLVDDFQDAVNFREGTKPLDLHQKLGVRIESRDVIRDGVEFAEASFDAVTSFDSMEHWHSSPKRLFHQLVECLKPGGIFILGVPNCVNMRKRIAVPLGMARWSGMDEWYEQDVFRGHVREPSVEDLQYIFHDLRLREIRTFGRNWLGLNSKRPFIKPITRMTDRLLRLQPSLCSNIYVSGVR